MQCVSCGTELIAGKAFCHACGTPAPAACRACGAFIGDGFRFCPDCGAAVAPSDAAPAPQTAANAAGQPPAALPEHLARSLRASTVAVDGERKLVTVFFCDLAGSTAIAERLDPEEYRDLLEQYVALAFREIYRFEGIVNQIAGDGLMALFGAPVAREEAPAHAIWAGLGILEALEQLNVRLVESGKPPLRARIGIHTGPVVVGTVGNDLKMDYTAIGDTTNLAARLESLAAPGTMLVSEETHGLVRGFFEMKPVGPFAVKGKAAPVTAYEVVCRRDAITPIAIAAERGLTPLVGRDQELAHLESCYARVSGQLPQVVTIVGESGAGRSRLVYELKQRLDPAPRLFEARCSALNRRVPFHPWTSMVQAYFGIRAGDAPEPAVRKVAARIAELGPEVQRSAAYLYRMLSLPAGDIDEVPADDLERETFDAVGHIFHAESREGPVVVIFEDVHWIDRPSLAMVERAIAKLQHAPMMMVLTYRPEFEAHWQTTAVLTQLRLRRLSDAAATEIVRNVAGGPLPTQLEQLILAKAEGSPFYAEEITRSLLESGILESSGGEQRLTRPVEEIRLPGTVQEVIAARLDSLDPQAKRVVQIAAVVGRQFRREQIESLLVEETVDVPAALAELERRGVVHRKSIFSDDGYRFGESLTQEVAYDGLLLRQRRQLHERIGRLLEEAPGEWTPERSAQLAWHYVNGENAEKAVRALLRAAADAEKVPSYSSSADYYREAWTIAEGRLTDQGDDAMRRLAVDAAHGIGRMVVLYSIAPPPHLLDLLAQAAAIAEQIGDRAAKATLLTFCGMETMLHVPGRFEDGLAIVEEALAEAELAGESLPGMARGLAWAYLLDGRFELARRTIDRAIAEMVDSRHGRTLSDIYISALHLRDRIDFYRGRLDLAEQGALVTRDLAARAGNRTVQSGCAATLAGICFLRAEYREALRWAEVSLAKAREIANPFGRRSEAAIAMLSMQALGDEDIRRFGEWFAGDIATDGDVGLSLPLVVAGLIALGESARARDLARAGYATAAGRFRRMLAAQALGDALAASDGDADEAAAFFVEAAEVAAATGALQNLVAALIGAAELAARNGDSAAAASLAARARAHLQGSDLVRHSQRLERLLDESDRAEFANIAVPAEA
jgi:class 3 adenylate cyclase